MSRLSGVYVKKFINISRNRFVYPKMGRHFLPTRFIRYYRRKGIINTIHRVFQKIRELFFRKPDILFFADLPRLKNEEYVLPADFGVEFVRNEAEVSRQDINILCEHIGEKIFRYQMEERFSEGALLWLVKVDGMLVGYIWTIRGTTIQPHFSPVTTNDVHFFDNFIFEEFRGRGINPVFVDYVLWKVRKEGLIRALIETKVTNTPEIRSLAKTHFKPYGLARKLNILGRSVTMWTQRTDLDKYRKTNWVGLM